MMTKIESRGVRCIDCRLLDLQMNKELAKDGTGLCTAAIDLRFVAVDRARNCVEFDPAPDEVITPRAAWVKTLPLFGPKKK